MTKREAIRRLDRALAREYGTPVAQLGNQRDPLDEAVYVILTFQTDVGRSKQTWAALKAHFPNWEQVEASPAVHLSCVLRGGGLHVQKARAIQRLLRAVRRRAGQLDLEFLRYLPAASAEKELLALPGISWKGARCVMLYALGRETFPVDVNTFRVFKRLGLIPQRERYRRRSLHDRLQELVRPGIRLRLHVNLVVHGQRTCSPTNPRCDGCAVRSICKMAGVSRRRRHAGNWR
jgi:endonuclease-3